MLFWTEVEWKGMEGIEKELAGSVVLRPFD